MIARSRAARAAGLDGLYLGDHHAASVPYFQNVPMLGRLSADWEDGRFGALFLLPLWHPVLVAEQVGTLAALGSGRFVLQCALGGGDAFAAMGRSVADRVRLFESALDVVLRLLDGDVVDDPDGPWGIRGARVSPVPSERVEVWIGATAPKAIERAARLGDTWYGGPELLDGVAGEKLRAYLDARARYGALPRTLPLRRDVYIGADAADVARVADAVAGYRGFDPGALVLGTVEQAAERFRALGELGFTEIVTRQLAPEQEDALASTARLGQVRAALAVT
jgi:alkanesulfonate monooxygenase SsuD/methylene tetrahydromethanopterin reductase-like flavin-dependent oxidoreductase (luciferase family)